MDVYFLKSAFFPQSSALCFFLSHWPGVVNQWYETFHLSVNFFFLLQSCPYSFSDYDTQTLFFLLNLSCHPLKTVKGLWKPDSQEHLGVFCSGRSWNFWLSAVFSGLGLLLGSVWRKLILRYIPFHLWSSSGFNPQWNSILFIFLEN